MTQIGEKGWGHLLIVAAKAEPFCFIHRIDSVTKCILICTRLFQCDFRIAKEKKKQGQIYIYKRRLICIKGDWYVMNLEFGLKEKGAIVVFFCKFHWSGLEFERLSLRRTACSWFSPSPSGPALESGLVMKPFSACICTCLGIEGWEISWLIVVVGVACALFLLSWRVDFPSSTSFCKF